LEVGRLAISLPPVDAAAPDQPDEALA